MSYWCNSCYTNTIVINWLIERVILFLQVWDATAPKVNIVTRALLPQKFLLKGVELVGEGLLSTEPTPSIFLLIHQNIYTNTIWFLLKFLVPRVIIIFVFFFFISVTLLSLFMHFLEPLGAKLIGAEINQLFFQLSAKACSVNFEYHWMESQYLPLCSFT